MAALYFFCLSVGWVYAQIQSIAHWVQPLFQDQISKGRPTIFYVPFKREKIYIHILLRVNFETRFMVLRSAIEL